MPVFKKKFIKLIHNGKLYDRVYKGYDLIVEGYNQSLEYTLISNTSSDAISTHLPVFTTISGKAGRRDYTFVLTDGSTTSDKNTPISNVSKVIVKYKEEDYNKISFNGLNYLESVNRLIITNRINDMENMFKSCSSLTILDVSNWDVSNVKNMYGIFNNCSSLTTLDVSKWDTDNVTNMDRMFCNCTSLISLDVSKWDTGKVYNMSIIFYNCTSITTLDVSNWDVSNVINMSGMFNGCSSLTTLDVSKWSTGKVTDMKNTFSGCSSLTSLDVSKWSTGNVINMQNTFSECSSLTSLDVSNWNTDNVTNIGWMFNTCNSLISLNLSNWNTDNVTNMSDIFYNCDSLASLDVSTWNTSKVNNMTRVFFNCKSLTSLDLSNFDTSKVKYMDDMFRNVSEISVLGWNYDGTNYTNFTLTEQQTGYAYNFPWNMHVVEYTIVDRTIEAAEANVPSVAVSAGDMIGAYTINPANQGKYYRYLPRIFIYYQPTDINPNHVVLTTNNGLTNDIDNILAADVTNIKVYYPKHTDSIRFEGIATLSEYSYIKELISINISSFNSFTYMFHSCIYLDTIDVSNWDTSNINNMSYMFYNCKRLQSLDVSNFNTINVTSMYSMFQGCEALSTLDVSNFNTINVSAMSFMFSDCSSLTTLDVSNWDVSSVTNMGYMFNGCSSLTSLDVSNWKVDKLKDATRLFCNCSSLTSLDLTRWSTSKVTDKTSMFAGCQQSCIGYYCPPIWTLPTSGDGFDITWVAPFNIYEVDLSLLDSTSVELYRNIYEVEPFTYWGDGAYDEELTHTYNDATSGIVIIYTNLFHTRKAANIVYNFISNSSTALISEHIPTITGASNLEYVFVLKDGTETTDTNTQIKDIEKVEVRFDDSLVTNISFEGLSLIKEITRFKLPRNITNTEYMFYNCTKLERINTIAWNMDDVTNVTSMFENCTSLKSLDLSNWNTVKVVECENMLLNVPEISDWNYDGTNYENFTLEEGQVGYCAHFPWAICVMEYTITIGFSSDLESNYSRFFLPQLYTSLDAGSYQNMEITPNMLDIVLRDGTILHDSSSLTKASVINNVEKIRVTYTPEVKWIRFNGAPAVESFYGFNHCLKEFIRFDTKYLISMEQMFFFSDFISNEVFENIDTRNVTSMKYLFYAYSGEDIKSLDLSKWDVSKVTDMEYMFMGCHALTSLNLSTWDTSKVTNSSNMFSTLDEVENWGYDGSNYENFTLSEVDTNYNGVFPWNAMEVKYRLGYESTNDYLSDINYKALSATGEVESVDLNHTITLKDGTTITSDENILVKDVDYITVECSKKGVYFGNNNINEIIQIDTSEFTTFRAMFSYCHMLTSLDLSDWDTSSVTDLDYMFYDCPNLTSLNLSNWDVTKVTTMECAFRDCPSLTSVNLSGWDTFNNIINVDRMFENFPILDAEGWNYDGTNYANFTITEIDSNYEGIFPWTQLVHAAYTIVPSTGNVLSSVQLPYNGEKYSYEITLKDGSIVDLDFNIILSDIEEIKVYYNKYQNIKFSGATGIDTIKYIDTSGMTSMFCMFENCESLVSLDTTSFNTSHVCDMNSMFYGCSELKTLDVSNWDTSKVTDMSDMFNGCSLIDSLNTTNWDVSNVTDMSSMFKNCSKIINLNTTNWDVSNVTDMSYMFYKRGINCSLNFSNWDTSKVTDMSFMFAGSTLNSHSPVVGLSNLNTSNVINMQSMFDYSGHISLITDYDLDLSGWDVRKVENMSNMFYYANYFRSINLSNWDIKNLINATSMFESCKDINSLNLSGWNTSNIQSCSKMLEKIPILTAEQWGYDGSNYDKFTLVEDQVSYAGDFPWSQFGYIEYEIEPMNDIDTLLTQNYNYYSYLPYYSFGDFDNGFQTTNPTSFTITLNDGTEVNDLNTKVNNISKIKIKFNKAIKNVTFSNFNRSTYVSNVLRFDCSHLTSMYCMFYGCEYITDLDLTNWDVSNVTKMYNMFCSCSNLTSLNLSNWDVSNVVDMQWMFTYCYELSVLNISNWNTASLTDMNHMFRCCYKLETLDLSNWDTSNLTDLSSTFNECTGLTTLDLSNWDTNKLESTEYLFYGCPNLTTLGDLSGWDTENLVYAAYTFSGCSSLTSIDLSGWNTSNVINTTEMFYNCTNLTSLNLSGWNTSSVADSKNMLKYVPVLTAQQWGYNGNNYTNFTLTEFETVYADMFPWTTEIGYFEYTVSPASTNNTVLSKPSSWDSYMYYLPKLFTDRGTSGYPSSNIVLTLSDRSETTDLTTTMGNVSKITLKFNKRYVNRISFDGNSTYNRVKTVGRFDCENITDFDSLFYSCTYLTSVDFSTWDTSKVTTFYHMFCNCSSLQTIDVSNLNTSNATDISSVFQRCTALKTITGLDRLDTSKATDMRGIFYDCTSLTSLDVSTFNTSNAENIRCMFYNCSNLTSITGLDSFDTSNVTDMYNLFYNCIKLETIPGLSNWDVSKVTRMDSVFDNCSILKSLDLSGWDATSATTTRYMFNRCPKLATIVGTKNLVKNNVTMTDYMFYNCNALTSVDMSGWDTSNVTSMTNMFSSCKALTSLDVSSWDTSNVTDMSRLFEVCSNLSSITGISNLNTSKVTDMRFMFYNVALTSLDLTNWEVRNVTSMYYMFGNSKSLTSLDLSNWNTSSLTDLGYMFSADSALQRLDLSTWNLRGDYNCYAAFSGCTSLTYLNVSTWDTSQVEGSNVMFENIPILTAEQWGYDGTNYNKFTLLEKDTYYPGKYPWSYQPVEFTITSRDDTDYLNTVVEGEYIYLPKFYDTETSSYSIDFPTIIITKKDGTISSDFSTTLAKDVEKIEVKYYRENKLVLGMVNATNSYYTYSQITTVTKLYTDRQTDLSRLFANCNLLTQVCDFNVTNLANNMDFMFINCEALNSLNVSTWNTSNVTSMESLFRRCSSLTSLDVSNWDTSYVGTMKFLFYNCNNLTSLDVSNWDTSSVNNMSSLFRNCYRISSLDLSNWDTSSVTEALSMFEGCSTLSEIPGITDLDTSNLNSAKYMFYHCTNLTSLDLSNWNTDNLTDIEGIFEGCTRLTSLNLSNWDTSNVTTKISAFSKIREIVDWGYDGTNYMDWTLTESETSYSGKFPWSETYIEYTMDTTDTEPLNFIGWDGISPNLPALYKKSGDFVYNYNSVIITKKDGSTTSNLTTTINNIQKVRLYYDSLDTTGIFFNYSDGLTHTGNGESAVFPSIKTLDYLDVKRFTTFKEMFAGCEDLVSVNTSNWVNNKVTDMAYMFESCSSLTSIDLSGIDTSNVTDLDYIFYHCSSLTNINLSGWEISKSVSVENSFYNVPTDTSRWIYNNIKFKPTRSECGFGTDFPWPSVTNDFIDFTLSSTKLPKLPSYLTIDRQGTYYFKPYSSSGYNYSSNYTALWPTNSAGVYGGDGVHGESNAAWICFKLVSDIDGQIQINLINYTESSDYDYMTIHVTDNNTQPTYSDTNRIYKSSSSGLSVQTVTHSLTNGTTYYFHIQYIKDSSYSSNLDAGLILSMRITDDENLFI